MYKSTDSYLLLFSHSVMSNYNDVILNVHAFSLYFLALFLFEVCLEPCASKFKPGEWEMVRLLRLLLWRTWY